jgi:hypothetical protein
MEILFCTFYKFIIILYYIIFLNFTRLGSHLTFVIVIKLLYAYFIESWIT